MASCAVNGCKNNRKFPKMDKEITFHSFPKGELRKVWLTLLGKTDENWKWPRNKVICSEHFEESAFVYYKYGSGIRRSLQPNSVPSVKLQGMSSTVRSGEHLVSHSVSHCASSETTEMPILLSEAHEMHPRRTLQIDSSYASTSCSTPIFDAAVPKRTLKRKITITDLSTSGSTSTDSSEKRKRTAQRIKFFHSYSLSPRSLEKKYVRVKRKHALIRQKFYDSKKKITALQKTIFNMKTVMTFVKNTQLLSEDAAENLEKTYDSVPHLLMQRYLKNVRNKTVSHESYPPILRRFAATLQFYSMKAYEAVRNEFALALPHQATIRKWYQNINCDPGFLTPAFDALKLKVEELRQKNHDLLCALILDEVSIKKQLDVDGTQTWGYVNIGVPTESDDIAPATEALVLMVVCLTGHWKLPVAYFFIASLSAKQKANIVNETLIRLHSIGVDVPSITCDGPTTNFAMFKQLGCDLDNLCDMKTWFSHPSATNKKVYCILDACHMLKLLRNNWSNLETIKNPNGDLVRWAYVKELYKLQEAEGLHVANKLKRAHMEWYRQKMKVHLAAQTLSNSVADAIEYLNTRCHLEEFKGSEATVDFIRKINDLFDLLNSRSPRASGLKAPLRLCNEGVWRPFILNTVHYLLRCTDVGGRPLHMTPKKTPFLGFAITSFSVCGIYDSLVKVEKLKYFLTYKVSQDHLEIFFCSIRSKNGWNNNPSCLQFMRTMRRLLLHTKINQGTGNCKVLDSTTILNVPSTATHLEQTIDVSLYRKYNYAFEPKDQILDHDYLCGETIALSEIISNVVTYISGYVIKMLQTRHKCEQCVLACESQEDITEGSYSLISFKNKGGLHVPSIAVVKICTRVEIAIRNIMVSTGNKIPNEIGFIEFFVTAIAQQFYQEIYTLFPSLNDHFLEFNICDENHGFLLIKTIVFCYCRIRFFNLAKKYTEKIQGSAVRRELNKLILFNHQ